MLVMTAAAQTVDQWRGICQTLQSRVEKASISEVR